MHHLLKCGFYFFGRGKDNDHVLLMFAPTPAAAPHSVCCKKEPKKTSLPCSHVCK